MLGAQDIKPNKTQSSPLRSLEFGGREWHGEEKRNFIKYTGIEDVIW